MDFSNFNFRSHYMGYLMTEPKGKSNLEKYNECLSSLSKKESEYMAMNPETKTAVKSLDAIIKLEEKRDQLKPLIDIPNLSVVCKSKLAQIYTETTTGRTKDIKNKYFEKGLMLEEDAITAYSLLTGKMFHKNKIRKSNEFINGELDFEDDEEDMVLDTKVSWDIFTFDQTKFSKLNPIYEWQGDCYMWLFNRKRFRLIYSCLNTPEHLILNEERKLSYEIPDNEVYKDACLELRRLHTYDDLPASRKIKVYDTFRSDERISRIEKRVVECRNYLNNIENMTDESEEIEETA